MLGAEGAVDGGERSFGAPQNDIYNKKVSVKGLNLSALSEMKKMKKSCGLILLLDSKRSEIILFCVLVLRFNINDNPQPSPLEANSLR